jgi:hypothetical protein
VIVHMGLPPRPKPRDAKAQLVLEWADVGFYIFRLVLTAVVLVLVLVFYGPAILELS